MRVARLAWSRLVRRVFQGVCRAAWKVSRTNGNTQSVTGQGAHALQCASEATDLFSRIRRKHLLDEVPAQDERLATD